MFGNPSVIQVPAAIGSHIGAVLFSTFEMLQCVLSCSRALLDLFYFNSQVQESATPGQGTSTGTGVSGHIYKCICPSEVFPRLMVTRIVLKKTLKDLPWNLQLGCFIQVQIFFHSYVVSFKGTHCQ